MSKNNKSKESIGFRILEYGMNYPLEFSYYLFFALGTIIRIIAALRATGILHPDEIFQSLEMAHLSVYGYGHIPPEFRSENPSIPTYSASRSWLFPLIFATLMRIGEFFNMDYHTQTLVMIRIFLGINASLLIPAVRKFGEAFSGKKEIGLLSGIFVAVWFRIIQISVRPFSNTFFLPLLFYGLYKAIQIIKQNKKFESNDHFIFFICLGLVTYIRTDVGIIVFAVFVVTFNLKKIKEYSMLLMDGVFGWLFGASFDYQYYNKFLVVPYNWFSFAMSHGDLFGVSPPSYYFTNLIVLDKLLFPFLISLLILVLSLGRKFGYFHSLRHVFSIMGENFTDGYIRLSLATLISWVILSSAWDTDGTHKEIRFAMATLTLTLTLFAYSVYFLSIFVEEYLIHKKLKEGGKIVDESRMIKIRAVYSWTNLAISVLLIILITTSSVTTQRYGNEAFADVNNALAYVGDQEDLDGLLVLSVWFLTGSYTYLHANTTIKYYSIQNNEDNLFWVESDLMRSDYNYFIAPYYELRGNGVLYDVLVENEWELVRIMDGKTEIWHNPTH